MPEVNVNSTTSSIRDRYDDLEIKIDDRYQELYTAIGVLHDSAQLSLIELVKKNMELEQRLDSLTNILISIGVVILGVMLLCLKTF